MDLTSLAQLVLCTQCQPFLFVAVAAGFSRELHLLFFIHCLLPIERQCCSKKKVCVCGSIIPLSKESPTVHVLSPLV